MIFRSRAVLLAVLLCSSAAMAQTHLALDIPESANVGVPFNVIVSALDLSGARVASYTGTVHFTATGTSVLPANYTFVPADAGRHTFSVTLNSQGQQTVTVTDGSTTANGSLNVACSGRGTTLSVSVPAVVCARSTGNAASMPAGLGSYSWFISNGDITAGQGTSAITFNAGEGSQVSFIVTTTNSSGCPGPDGAGTTLVHVLPTAQLPSSIHTCPGKQMTIPVKLTGTAPFTITWSDGFQQQNVNSLTTERKFTTTSAMTLKITSITDNTCANTGPSVSIIFDSYPIFGLQPVNASIKSGERATLSASANPVVKMEWFEGEVGDQAKIVGTGETFTTPPLSKTTKYWALASSECASTASAQVTVTVTPGAPTAPARRRAVGRGR